MTNQQKKVRSQKKITPGCVCFLFPSGFLRKQKNTQNHAQDVFFLNWAQVADPEEF